MDESTLTAEFANVRRELADIRRLVTEGIIALRDAEKEIPEKLRRFMNYVHDIHGMKFMYEELGHQAPKWLHNELERVDDRYRQIIAEMNAEGGPINKIRREMASDPANRWDHTRQLAAPKKETTNEAGPSVVVQDGIDESGTEVPGS